MFTKNIAVEKTTNEITKLEKRDFINIRVFDGTQIEDTHREQHMVLSNVDGLLICKSHDLSYSESPAKCTDIVPFFIVGDKIRVGLHNKTYDVELSIIGEVGSDICDLPIFISGGELSYTKTTTTTEQQNVPVEIGDHVITKDYKCVNGTLPVHKVIGISECEIVLQNDKTKIFEIIGVHWAQEYLKFVTKK